MPYHGELLVPVGVLEHCEHHLADIEGVVPVVVLDGGVAVVLLHRHSPPAERHVVNLKVGQDPEVSEHTDCGLAKNGRRKVHGLKTNCQRLIVPR